jgi:hypothetical protein
MDKWVTVLTTILPQQLWIIRGRLESEGIECFIKDELTIQSYNLYSNSVGGVKLQVLEKDQQRAVELLVELGYLKDEPVRPDLLTVLDEKTANFFLLNRLTIGKRVIILLVLAISMFVSILYFVFKPDTYRTLIDTPWCVSKIYFQGKLIQPNTLEAVSLNLIDGEGNSVNCESLFFRGGHNIILPGINSNSVNGYWKLNDNETIFINAHVFSEIYNGTYDLDISPNQLTLKSKTTVIYANKLNF